MRLIDLDALEMQRCDPYVFEDRAWADGWNAALDALNKQPEVDIKQLIAKAEVNQVMEDPDADYDFDKMIAKTINKVPKTCQTLS